MQLDDGWGVPVRFVLAGLAIMIALSTLETWAVVGESGLIAAGSELSYQGTDFLAGKLVLGLCLVLVLSLALPSSPAIKALAMLAAIAVVVVVVASWVNVKGYAADETLRAASAEAPPALRPLLESEENRRHLVDTTTRGAPVHRSAVLALITLAVLSGSLVMSRLSDSKGNAIPEGT